METIKPGYQRMSFIERWVASFMPVTESGCFLWIGAVDGDKYGEIRRNTRRYKAHRLSWEIHYGSIPKGMQVLHRCDVPSCVRPEHLFLGTCADNMLDKKIKGRAHHKITSSQRAEIVLHAAGQDEKLAKLYGVSRSYVRHLRCMKKCG